MNPKFILFRSAHFELNVTSRLRLLGFENPLQKPGREPDKVLLTSVTTALHDLTTSTLVTAPQSEVPPTTNSKNNIKKLFTINRSTGLCEHFC